jgi:hypothetical protein
MIYECTDCKWCANFSEGFRIFCLNKELPSEEVCKYYPVGEEDAERCNQFDDNTYYQVEFSSEDFGKAEKFSEEKYQDVTYKGVREWCEEQIKLNNGKKSIY